MNDIVINPQINKSKALKLAALYNFAWGAWVIIFPNSFFDFISIERPNYPEIWQCVGMIVGVYGIGYWLASNNPIQHYPIVLVGFLGKILGPIGFLQALITGRFPLAFGMIIVFNDLIWLPSFYKILREKYGKDKTLFS
jgi:small multidrug resistance pump